MIEDQFQVRIIKGDKMGKKVYTGFSAAQETQIKKIVSTASDALTKAYAVHIKGSDSAEFTKWFGTGNRNTVKEILHKMNYAMLNGNIDISYNSGGHCDGGNTNAVAFMPAHGWNVANVNQAKNVNFNLVICPRLLKIMSSLGSDNQSQVGTLLHEISHLLGGTDDETDPTTGNIAYGAAAAKNLAKNHPGLAINNAENFGFYISSFIKR